MRLLYVDNFRGFAHQFIPLKEVNFFLGENSTGKSSILALINLFSSPLLWLQQEFNTDEFQLGNYRDIVSVNAIDSNFFRIGLIECPLKQIQEKIPAVFAFLMEFHEKDGIPSISKYCYINKTNAVQILFTNNGIKYKINSIEYSKEPDKKMMQIFQSWIATKVNESDFKKLKVPTSLRFRTPLPIIANLIEEEIKIKKKCDKISLYLRMPDFAHNFTWIAPLRSKPKRTYDQYKFVFSPEGDHAPYLVRKFLENNRSKQAVKFHNFIQHYGKKSGLLKDIGIKKLGSHSASPFQLNIILEDKPLNISNVGYGVSQSLPILVELFARPKNSWFAIQQPEVHLHPRAQAILGDIFCDLALREKKRFFIETHSDFIIDRFRSKVRQCKEPLDSQVIFFEQINGLNKAHPIKIQSDGKYADDQPESFRLFFIKEELSVLGIR